jgi:hypothetical protein
MHVLTIAHSGVMNSITITAYHIFHLSNEFCGEKGHRIVRISFE